MHVCLFVRISALYTILLPRRLPRFCSTRWSIPPFPNSSFAYWTGQFKNRHSSARRVKMRICVDDWLIDVGRGAATYSRTVGGVLDHCPSDRACHPQLPTFRRFVQPGAPVHTPRRTSFLSVGLSFSLYCVRVWFVRPACSPFFLYPSIHREILRNFIIDWNWLLLWW